MIALIVLIAIVIFVCILVFFGYIGRLVIKYTSQNGKVIKIVGFIIGISIILLPWFIAFESTTNFFQRRVIRTQIEHYISTYLSDSGFDFVVGPIEWRRMGLFAGPGGRFEAQVYDRYNPNLWFVISHDRQSGRLGYNFDGFVYRLLEYEIAPLLEKEFYSEFYRIPNFAAWVVPRRNAGMTSSDALTIRVEIFSEYASPIALAEIISRYHEFLTKSGFSIELYSFDIRYAGAPYLHFDPNSLWSIEISIITELINDDLPMLIEYARENGGGQDRFRPFTTDGFWYLSNVDETQGELSKS